MPALVALKNACLEIVDGMRGSPSQMRIAAALATAKRCNKFVILHNKGMLFHKPPTPSHSASADMPAILGAGSALRRPSPRQVTIIRLEDGEERAFPRLLLINAVFHGVVTDFKPLSRSSGEELSRPS